MIFVIAWWSAFATLAVAPAPAYLREALPPAAHERSSPRHQRFVPARADNMLAMRHIHDTKEHDHEHSSVCPPGVRSAEGRVGLDRSRARKTLFISLTFFSPTVTAGHSIRELLGAAHGAACLPMSFVMLLGRRLRAERRQQIGIASTRNAMAFPSLGPSHSSPRRSPASTRPVSVNRRNPQAGLTCLN